MSQGGADTSSGATSDHITHHHSHHHHTDTHKTDSISPSPSLSSHQRLSPATLGAPGSITTTPVSPGGGTKEDIGEEEEEGELEENVDSSPDELTLPFDPDDLDKCELLNTSRLNEWDYPIFDLSCQAQTTVLSKVSFSL